MKFDDHIVSVARVAVYDPELIAEAIEKALAPLGSITRFVRPGQKVLLKPNLLGAFSPEKAVTTHPEVVRALTRIIQNAGGKVALGDGPGVGAIGTVLKVTGMQQVIDELGIELADMDKEGVFTCEGNVIGKRVHLSEALREYDVVINLPKAKTHVQMVYTGAVKNLYGLLPGSLKGEYHYRIREREYLADFILDLNRLAPIAFSLMDAVVGMEGEGPSGGQPRELGFLAASADPVALDAVTAYAMNLDLEQLPIQLAAQKRNFGVPRAENVELLGATLAELRVMDFKHIRAMTDPLRLLPLPQFMLNILQRHWKALPSIDRKRCIKCMNCKNGCPVKPVPAIDPAKSPQADRKLCIKCYCCHEFCPVKAIELKPTCLERFIMTPRRVRAMQKMAGWFKNLIMK